MAKTQRQNRLVVDAAREALNYELALYEARDALDEAREALDDAREALDDAALEKRAAQFNAALEVSTTGRAKRAAQFNAALSAGLEERAAQNERAPRRVLGPRPLYAGAPAVYAMMVPANTPHAPTCETGGAFGHFDTTNCERCRELDAGAPPRRGWGPGRYG
jgi:hypothetical protein